MVNLIGEVPDQEPLLAIPDVHLHLYGKASRPDRKVGHVTVRAETPGRLEALLGDVAAQTGIRL